MAGRRLDDNFISMVMGLIERAANTASPCPTNEEMAHAGNRKSMSSGAKAVALLEERGAITVQRGTSSRIITVVETGRRTGGRLRATRVYGKGSRPRQKVPVAVRSAGAVIGPPVPAEPPSERGICPRCGVRTEVGCRHVSREMVL